MDTLEDGDEKPAVTERAWEVIGLSIIDSVIRSHTSDQSLVRDLHRQNNS